MLFYRQQEARVAVFVLRREADGLVVVYLDLPEDVVLDEALQDGAVHLAEKLAGVLGVVGDDDEAVVVDNVAGQVSRGAGFVAARGTRDALKPTSNSFFLKKNHVIFCVGNKVFLISFFRQMKMGTRTVVVSLKNMFLKTS